MIEKPDKRKARRKRDRVRSVVRAAFQGDVLAAAGYQCENPDCDHDRRLGASGHHITYKAQSIDDSLANGIALCARCHNIAHNGMGLHGISGHQFVVNTLTKLVESQTGEARWGQTLQKIKDRWNL